MKIVRNRYIPFPGYKAINLFGVLFVKNNAKLSDVDINHEKIHSEQYKEVTYLSVSLFGVIGLIFGNLIILISPFIYYILYVLEWLIRLIQFRQGSYMAYRNISFEREAYQNQEDLYYLKGRKFLGFLNYL